MSKVNNMYEKNINDLYAYSTNFNITSSNDIDDLWSYFIFRLNLENNEETYDRFARLYNFINRYKNELSIINNINITIKETSTEYYMYIESSIRSMMGDFMNRLEDLNYEYTYEKNILSYSINKISTKKTPIIQNKNTEEHIIYDFIAENDLDEMINCINKMKDSSYNNVYLKDFSSYKDTILYFSNTLQLYPQLIKVSTFVAELSFILLHYEDECLNLGIDFKTLLQSFINNIANWQEKLFITGEEELHFLDDSFEADLSQIKMALNLYDVQDKEDSASSLDDIFDFA